MAQLIINVPETSDLMRYLPQVCEEFINGDALSGAEGPFANWQVVKD